MNTLELEGPTHRQARHELQVIRERVADKIARLQVEWEAEVGPIDIPEEMIGCNISHDI